MTLIIEYRRIGPHRRRVNRTPEEAAEVRKRAAEKAAEKNRRRNQDGLNIAEKPMPLPKSKPNPIEVAQMTLGGRLKERALYDRVSWFLDGRPTNLDLVMRETNRVRKLWNMEQVTACERWVLHD